MRYKFIITVPLVTLLCLMVAGCAATQEGQIDSDEYSISEVKSIRKTFEDRDAAVRSLLSITADMVKRLQSLPDDDKQAVVATVALSQIVAAYAHSRTRPDETIVAGFYEAFGALSPGISGRIDSRSIVFACLDESIAYASAMARCLEDDNKSEVQCDKESASAASAELLCMMGQIEALKGVLGNIFEFKFPPGPQPRPIK